MPSFACFLSLHWLHHNTISKHSASISYIWSQSILQASLCLCNRDSETFQMPSRQLCWESIIIVILTHSTPYSGSVFTGGTNLRWAWLTCRRNTYAKLSALGNQEYTIKQGANEKPNLTSNFFSLNSVIYILQTAKMKDLHYLPKILEFISYILTYLLSSIPLPNHHSIWHSPVWVTLQ